MKESEPVEHGGGLRIADGVFALYRHRWLILAMSLLGLVAAGWLYQRESPSYESTAKIYVRYVTDNRSMDPLAGERPISPDSRGEGVLNTEVQILTSWDLAIDVVAQIQESLEPVVGTTAGPERLPAPDGGVVLDDRLGGIRSTRAAGGGTNAPAGSWLQRVRRLAVEFWGGSPAGTIGDMTPLRVLQGIRVEAPRRGSTMTVSWRGMQEENPPEVLRRIVASYLERHREVHRGTEALLKKFEEQRSDAEATMRGHERRMNEQLSELKVTSIAEAKTALNTELTRVRESLVVAQADLAEQEARLGVLEGRVGEAPDGATGGTPETNQVVTSGERAAPQVVQEYRELVERIAALRRERGQLMGRFTDFSPLVIHLREQIAAAEERQRAMELEHRGLSVDPVRMAVVRDGQERSEGPDLLDETARVAALRGRIRNLSGQEAALLTRLGDLQSRELVLSDLERKFHIAHTNYVYLEEQVRRSVLDKDLDAELQKDGTPNVTVIQRPSPAVRNNQARLQKAGIALAAGFGLPVLYALVFGLLLDQRLRKASEVEVRAGLPVMLSIPNIRGMQRINVRMPMLPPFAGGGESDVPLLADLVTDRATLPRGETDTSFERKSSPWRKDNPLRPYFEALRDRLVLFFQLRNMQHKPKLVAVTGCTAGAGATTLAAGLAAAMSETGDGKVLLVDLNLGRGAVHPFLRGSPVRALNEFLEDGAVREEDAKLVVAKADGEEGGARLPSGRLHQLVPKMRASDFDFIIFDMPSISETSATVALAASMDHVLVVVEGEETLQGEVKRAAQMLRRYGASVSGVFNKSRLNAPKWLLSE